MSPEWPFGRAWVELSRRDGAAAQRAGLKAGHATRQRSLLWFALKLLLSNSCRLFQESVSSWVHCWLDPGLLPQSAASLHGSPLARWAHCHGGTAESQAAQQGGHGLVSASGGSGGAPLSAVSFCFSYGHQSRAAGDSLEKAAGGWLGALLGRGELWVVFVPETQLSAAGSSVGCCGSLFFSNDSNQGNIFELTGLCSAVSKQPVLQLLRSEIMWIESEIILLDAIVQGTASGENFSKIQFQLWNCLLASWGERNEVCCTVCCISWLVGSVSRHCSEHILALQFATCGFCYS